MAERFVKPPVNLVVKFPCSIRVKAIIINNTSGSFTSDSFEVCIFCHNQGNMCITHIESTYDRPIF